MYLSEIAVNLCTPLPIRLLQFSYLIFDFFFIFNISVKECIPPPLLPRVLCEIYMTTQDLAQINKTPVKTRTPLAHGYSDRALIKARGSLNCTLRQVADLD